jgi:surface protein
MVFIATNATLQPAVDGWCNGSITSSTPLNGGTYGAIGDWIVTNVTDMSNLFYNKQLFNDDISNWDVSNVTNMFQMFFNAEAFNNGQTNNEGTAPMNWDVSNVTTMTSMFHGTPFNQPIGYWNVSKVTDMSLMFSGTTINGIAIGNGKGFNQDISTKENVTMHGSTYTAWDVSNVTGMYGMFYENGVFAKSISNWDVSNVTDMECMFFASNINLPIGNWNVSNVTRMVYMFSNNSKFNQNLSNWRFPKVSDLSNMFDSATAFNNGQATNEGTAPLNWDVSNVTNMVFMFYGATSFNQPIGNWNTSKVTSMYLMFSGASLFDQPINTQEVTVDSLTYTAWDVSKVTNTQELFMDTPFNQDISNWDVSNVEFMLNMFQGNKFFNQDISNWDVSNVTNMSAMFWGATAFNNGQTNNEGTAPLNWTLSKITALYEMFNGATSFNQPIGNWDVSKVSNLGLMFYGATSFNQPIDNWDVSNVTNMSAMFSNSAFNQSINDWDVSKVTNFTYMFDTNNAFYQSIRVWAVDNSANTTNMFYKATGLQRYYAGTNLYEATPSPSVFFNLGYSPPEITIIGDNPVTIQAKSTYTDLGATATDSEGNSLIVVSDTSDVNIDLIGTYTVTYNVTDSNGNAAIQRARTVIVVDTQRPIITLIGDETVTFVVNTPGNYVDAGATATDSYYGNVTSDIEVTTNVSSSKIGKYTVKYNVTDESGNAAYEVTRTVNVVDSPPTITLIGDSITHVIITNKYIDAGATATDNLDGSLTVRAYTGDVDTSKLGTYTVSYNVTNSVGLAATTVYRTVIVYDDSIPIITLIGDNPVTVQIGQTYTDAGAIAMDAIYGNITDLMVINNDDVNTSTVGTYTYIYNVTNAAGLQAKTVTRAVNVIRTPPTITLIGSSKVTVDVGISYNDPGATATDAVDGTITDEIVTVSNVNINIPGRYKIAYDVVNSAGLSATTAYRTVTVADPYFPTIIIVGITPVNIEKYSLYKDAGATATDYIDGTITDQITTVSNVNTIIVGTYTVIYSVTDAEGNTSKAIRHVNVVDEPPVITLIGENQVTVQLGEPYTDAGATAGDSIDGDLTHYITTNIDDLDTTKLGTFRLTYNVSDEAGLDAVEVIRTITVHDPYSPIIVMGGITPITIEIGSVYTDAGATATDYVDGNITDQIITVSNLDKDNVGTYTITYNVTDEEGNSAIERIRTINVIDSPPVIKLIGDNPVTVEYGQTYTDLGATAGDTVDGDLTNDIQTNIAELDTTKIGTFLLTYNVSDAAGLAALQVTRSVIIYDPYPPTISIVGASPITIEINSVYTDVGATATDVVDGTITDKIITVNNVDTTKVGTYTVTYNVTDAEGNAATERTRIVNVVDVPPVIILNGKSIVTIDYGKTYTDLGATATDYVDSDLTNDIETNIDELDTTTIGPFKLTYNVSDAGGLAAVEVIRTIIVHDPYLPTIALKGETPIIVEKNSLYIDAGATAWDQIDGEITSDIVVDITDVNTSIVGSYTVTYNVTDAEGNAAAEVTRTVNVVDAPPVITINGSNPVSYECKSTIPYSDAGAFASDIVDGDLTDQITSNIGDLDTTTVNTFNLIYTVADSAGNSVTKTRVINIVDTIAPGIIINGAYPVTIEINSIYADEGASAYDIVSGDLTAIITTTGQVNTSIAGTYQITYSATDDSKNTYTAYRTVIVIDAKPVIILNGSATVIIDIDEKYNDLGASASDSVDGDLTNAIKTYNPLLTYTSKVGSYKVRYNVRDIAGNSADEVIRTVIVQDPYLPTISLNGITPVTIERYSKYDSSIDAGATALDKIDGDITTDIQTVIDVNTNKVGTYTVTYNVTDNEGNSAKTVTRTVYVVDVPPVIQINGTSPISIDLGATYNDLGATATNYVDGDLTSDIITYNPVNTSKPGTYIVRYNVKDIVGNAANEVTRTVTVHDPYIPVIVRFGLDPVTIEKNSTYVDEGALATDKLDGDLTNVIVTYNPLLTDTSKVGTYIVTYDVTDSAGNKAKTVTRTVNVVDTPPIIIINGDTLVTVDLGVTYNDAGATAGDYVDGDLTSNIVTYNPVNTNKSGIYQVTYNVKDKSGIAAIEVTRTVVVHDPYIPTIIMRGITPITVEQNVNPTYIDAGAIATDKIDGDITGRIVTVNLVNQNNVGTYLVTYDVTDFEGNKANTVTRVVNVVNVRPVIKINGSNPLMVDLGETYIDAGATAGDNVDGDLTSEIETVNRVDTSKPGIYTVAYNVNNSSGKAAVEVMRTVIVHDPYIPTILILGITPVTINVGETYIDAGAIATDKIDGDITGSIKTVSSVNTNKAGTYTVIYNVSDYEGNDANTATRIVIVQDSNIPYTKQKDSYYVGDSDKASTISILSRGWNTAFAGDTYNGKTRAITPFRAVNNSGDFLSRQNYKCGGPTGMSKSSVGWAGSIIFLGSQIDNCDDSGVPGASGNVKYVYDSSDYISFRRQQAINRNYYGR